MKMRAVQVAEKNAPLTLVERDVPEPGPGEVRVRVQACGICHSDAVYDFTADSTTVPNRLLVPQLRRPVRNTNHPSAAPLWRNS